MSRNQSLALSLMAVMLSLSGASAAQFWSGVLAPSRAIDWSQAGAGAIPARPSPGSNCATLNPGATAAQINSAIASCPANGVVFLNAGTYNLSGPITISNHSNVTLRGAGPDQTTLVWSAGFNCTGLGGQVCISNGDNNWWGGPGNTATWTAGYAQGATTLTFGTVTGSAATLRPGTIMQLDQNDDTTDQGGIFMCQAFGVGTNCSIYGSTGMGRPGRAQAQNVTVVSCTGANSKPCSGGSATAPYTVVITPGLYAPNWRSSQSPGAWWSSNLPVTGVGIEDLTVDHRNVGTGGAGTFFQNASKCWVKNVRSLNATVHKHLWIWQSNHITVRDSYFYGSSPSREGYGVDSGGESSDNLIENNIFQHMATATITEGDAGSVYGYNYKVDTFYDVDPAWQTADADHHAAGDHFELWEGHEGSILQPDGMRGSGFMITGFRDYLDGREVATENGPKSHATFAFFAMNNNRYNNVVGSVMGTQSYHTRYQTTAANQTECGDGSVAAKSVFVMGYSDQAGVRFATACGFGWDISNDLLSASTLMRWGNYAACTGDSACNAVRFVAGENASGAPVYPGLANPSQTLPPSFYLSSKPSWWGTMPWPAVGPDVTGGNIPNVGGHAYHNPAANCYLNVMGGKTDGSSGVLAFNADSCYAGGGPPPPAHLQGAAH